MVSLTQTLFFAGIIIAVLLVILIFFAIRNPFGAAAKFLEIFFTLIIRIAESIQSSGAFKQLAFLLLYAISGFIVFLILVQVWFLLTQSAATFSDPGFLWFTIISLSIFFTIITPQAYFPVPYKILFIGTIILIFSFTTFNINIGGFATNVASSVQSSISDLLCLMNPACVASKVETSQAETNQAPRYSIQISSGFNENRNLYTLDDPQYDFDFFVRLTIDRTVINITDYICEINGREVYKASEHEEGKGYISKFQQLSNQQIPCPVDISDLEAKGYLRTESTNKITLRILVEASTFCTYPLYIVEEGFVLQQLETFTTLTEEEIYNDIIFATNDNIFSQMKFFCSNDLFSLSTRTPKSPLLYEAGGRNSDKNILLEISPGDSKALGSLTSLGRAQLFIPQSLNYEIKSDQEQVTTCSTDQPQECIDFSNLKSSGNNKIRFDYAVSVNTFEQQFGLEELELDVTGSFTKSSPEFRFSYTNEVSS